MQTFSYKESYDTYKLILQIHWSNSPETEMKATGNLLV